MTTHVLRLVGVLLTDPDKEWYGLRLAAEAGLKSGTVYLVLERLEGAKWLTSRWEAIDPAVEGRPRRRLYRITAEGRRGAEQAIDELVGALGVPAAAVRAARSLSPGRVAPAT